jgi:hypothetical protein
MHMAARLRDRSDELGLGGGAALTHVDHPAPDRGLPQQAPLRRAIEPARFVAR